MSLHSKPLAAGDLVGVILDFDTAGDMLPMHNHGQNDVHIAIVARGSFLVRGPTFDPITAKTGAVLDWEPGVAHEFEAIEPQSRLINIVKIAAR